MIVRTSIGGDGVRLTLSNALGMDTVRIGAVHVALRERDSAIVAGTDRTVTFGGRTSLSVEPGALVVSDTIALAVPALTELAVSLYLPNETRSVTTHEFALNTTYVAAGNAAGAAAVAERSDESHVFLADRSRGARPDAGGARSSRSAIRSPTASRRRPVRTERGRRYSPRSCKRAPQRANGRVINAGISGNRVRRDVIGRSALGRFDRDVLGRAGVQWICCSKASTTSPSRRCRTCRRAQRTTADELIAALEQLVDRAHARGIKVMGGTLMPMGGLWLHNAETEAMRQAVNEWIRTSGKFDAVADFDAATRDPQQPARLKPDFDSGDHIHPNDAGNAAMANAIDTTIFAR